jgi:hypothetical protein
MPAAAVIALEGALMSIGAVWSPWFDESADRHGRGARHIGEIAVLPLWRCATVTRQPLSQNGPLLSGRDGGDAPGIRSTPLSLRPSVNDGCPFPAGTGRAPRRCKIRETS